MALSRSGWELATVCLEGQEIERHMPWAFELSYTDSSIAVGSCGPIVVVLLTRPGRLEHMREIASLTERVLHGSERLYSISVLEKGAMLGGLSGDVREMAAEMSRKYPHSGSAIVVEGEGFGVAAMRAVLSGIFFITRNRTQIFTSPQDAAEWLSAQVNELEADSLTVVGLVDAIEAARRAAHRHS